jgi:hydroxymethylbilane synthase
VNKDPQVPHLRIGTRKSPLARWQAQWVAAELEKLGNSIEMVWIVTQGDVTAQPLGTVGGQGLFTKEIQRALLDGEIDLAVHSLKDLPTQPIDGLALAAVPQREVVGDCLIAPLGTTIENLPLGARIGTGSLRRAAQLRAWRADLEILDIRGNVETRIKKLDDGIYEAIVLAEAGLHRLGYLDRVAQKLPLHRLLPAVGQGALGLETRADDETTLKALSALNHAASQLAVTAERSLLAHLRGGCLAPVAAWCRMEDDKLRLEAKVLSLDGQTQLQADRRFAPDQAQEEGRLAAEELIAAGAQQLIESARTKPPTPST